MKFSIMKFSPMKLIRTLHAWGGLTLALLLLLSSITGTLLVWKEDYVKLITPEAQVDFIPTPKALAVIAEAVEAQFENNDILNIQFATEQFPLTKVTLYDTNYAYVDIQGNVVDQWYMNDRAEEWLYDLHHRLLLDDLGLTITGLAAIALLILVLLGVITFIPLRRQFRKGVLPENLQRSELVISHRNLGSVIALPLLLTLVTGIILAFPFQAEELLLDELRQTPEYSDAMVVGIDEINGEGVGDWLPAMERTLAVFPGAVIRSASVPSGFSIHRIIGVQQEGEWNRTGMSVTYIDEEMGYMDLRIDAQNFPLTERVFNTVYPLHTGKTGSLIYKLWITFFGIGAALLSSLGMTSFIKSKIGNR
jgi:uncharacterized iron-regulated membrane protein